MPEPILSEPAIPDSVLPPGQESLPCDDGIPMETQRHKLQMDLLVDSLQPWLVQRQGQGYVGGNMFVYFSPNQVRHQDYRGPDVFVALDVSPHERKSWVVWEEGKAPDVVIELLSDSTAVQDKTQKKAIYQNQLRVTEYFWYDPFNPNDFAGFTLEHGQYEPMTPNAAGWLISRQLGLVLIRWQGDFKDVTSTWLRWATLDGTLLPTDRERLNEERQRADQERQRADQERQRADQERQRADQLAARLRALGIDPEHL